MQGFCPCATRRQAGDHVEGLAEQWMCKEGCTVLARNKRWGGAEWDRIVISPPPQRDLLFCEIKLLAWTAGPSFSEWVKLWLGGAQFRRQQHALLRLQNDCEARGYGLQRHLLICVNRGACCPLTVSSVPGVNCPECRRRGAGEPFIAFDLVSGKEWSFASP